VHDIKNMPLDKFNTEHYFDVFSFGDEYPNQFNPLERKSQKAFSVKKNSPKSQKDNNAQINRIFDEFISLDIFSRQEGDSSKSKAITYSYFLKIVPTTYEYLDGKIVNNTYQYSVTKSSKLISSNVLMTSQLPGIFVSYELSPIMVKFVEKSKSFTHFITSCCAIIGGLYTIAGLFDSLSYKYYNMYKKHQINKLT
jgi:hypothetical protein